MNKITTYLIILFLVIATPIFSQIDARMFQHPDVSKTQIVFTYAEDIWIVSKEGGQATKLSSPDGFEGFARFSPDGNQIAFSGNYHGNFDIYVMPVKGGLPNRLTYHHSGDWVIDWHPDGNKVLFVSTRESGRQRFSQFYTISLEGGMAEKLQIPYGENASYSPDGQKLAYTDKSRAFRTWKRYRGGMAPDITLFDLSATTSEFVAESNANDEFPMWSGTKIYFLSDRGTEKRHNLWSYDISSRQIKQLTDFNDFDIHHPSIGPEDIVFEAGGKLYLFSLATEQYKELKIYVVSDLISLQPVSKNASKNIQSVTVSPDGNRAIFSARGDLFDLPSEKGYVKNLTQTSGVAERHPAWSPDSKSVAFFSDKSGEYELTIIDLESGSEKKLTSYGPGFRYHLIWSPDSKKLAFVEQTMIIKIYDMETNQTTEVDQGLYMFEGNLRNFKPSWSSDSRWLAYDINTDRRGYNAIFLYDYQNKVRHQVTSGYYGAFSPAFDPEGKYLYILTNQTFGPAYSDFDNSFIYPNATGVAAIALRKDVPSPLAPENDEAKVEEDKKEEDTADAKKKKGKKDKDKKEDEKKEEIKTVEIDLDGFEDRLVLLPPQAGNYKALDAVKGKVIYHKMPRTGSGEKERPIIYWDLEEREEKTIIGDAVAYQLAANGEKMLVSSKGSFAIIKVASSQKIDKKIPTGEMQMTVTPREEWQQIFNDAWRLERDFFYDKNMHGLDWKAMREKYGKMVDDAMSREDVNYVLGELIGEMNASHTYRYGGDIPATKRRSVGYLGIDWEIANGYYRVNKIIKGAAWDAEVRSPLAEPGVEVKEGDYILAVNNVPLDIHKEPYAAFEGLASKTVELLVNSQPSPNGAKKVIVKTLNNETRLRHLAWIEANRLYVDEATNGKIGYIYVRSTGMDGQSELVRQFSGQYNKEGLIIDERFNSGGQIPDRFVELLNRKPLAFWAVRDGKDWQQPPAANFGPKAMLINGWSGSGGDAFPDYFRKAGLGPLIGSRTWGGLIGYTGVPELIDGGGVTVPTFRMYDPDGEWFKEGYGVDPDIEVKENAAQLAKGIDVQLDKAIEDVMGRLNSSFKKPDHPDWEKR